jgi:hypothetical protein
MATQARIRLASVVACLAVSACSLISTFDGLTDGGATTITHDGGRDAEIIDGNPVTDVGTEAGPACTPGATMCVPPSSGTAQSSLQECDNGVEQVTPCVYGCVVQEPDGGAAGASTPVSLCSPCFMGGKYCGGDKIGTDPHTLYICNPDGTASIFESCVLGCKVNATGDDSCQ